MKLCSLKTELADINQITPIFQLMKHLDIYLTIQLFIEYDLENLVRTIIRKILGNREFYGNISYGDKNYHLKSGVRKFYDLLDKMVIDFLG